MIILAWPWALAALPLPLLARLLPAVGPGSGAALRLPSLQADGALDLAGAPRHRRLGLILAWIAWALLVLATARPEWLGDPVTLPL
ncbi:MAG: BatB protein, partial [Chromatiaceae bacterium]|nr:BatB protein [Chromatiaceae bacterium]